ncbi:MIP/aquaporin family protein [Streptococcus pyogenes]|uniref:Glycerol uptake facilitator protein n=1 Tax=Streptococcus pyogenes serotype M12 (strain MGAS9429) TaxID=370551 RepID=Q1JKK5_STRPC|nr:MIP/aquaporin family protein [Streptococcus pyogenes]HEP6289860.1 aquaporin family protein [Streptococcus pyogenes ABC020038314]HEP6345218.1 aquaporin family protein [Streptococcus pyogenes ABC020028455]HEQ1585741.1 aquaporin family protein [Streptococcus pyogenes ABC020063118]ABF32564.1 glycerol uptake facilitator protein [Streptococcus pyogenes MGAS9429]EZK54445.1 glycerol uptake facilitator protein [Streptococcus pyogenes ABC020054973]
MDIFGEFLGTALLVLLGNGVVAGVVLPKTKTHASGWIVIATGWGIAVAVAVFISGKVAPAHLNPAVSLAQLLGAMVGSTLVFLQFRPHYLAAESQADILGTFATGPAIRDTSSNLLSEIFGTFVLMLGILAFGLYDMPAGLGTLCVGTLVIGIGLSLGGTTGYAINPARDLGPRLVHAILPLNNKGDSDWSYAWIPVVGPIIGAALAVLLFQVMS